MNELAMVFDRMGIKTVDVIEAMNTKWNALGFYPGLVGGHCIGVDPYYFIYQAEMLGYHSQIIAAGRTINENMGSFIATAVIKRMIQAGKHVSQASIYLLGLTFKENIPDMRNSKAVDVVKQLTSFGIRVNVVDPFITKSENLSELNADLVGLSEVNNADCLVFLVAHRQFAELTLSELDRMFKPREGNTQPVLIDVKNIFDQKMMEDHGYSYWSL
jgi:UDP-N-acetyl-D-glucosamine/UDP-N-acetyl-D-galactosamine dehydrogenase